MQTEEGYTLCGYYGADNLGDELLLLVCQGNLSLSAILDRKAIWESLFSILQTKRGLVFGGGSLFQNSTSLASLLYYAGLAHWAFFWGKPVHLLCQGLGPLEGSLAKIIAASVFQLASTASMRELGATEIALLAAWGIDYTADADLVWALESPAASLPSISTRPVFLINLRPAKQLTQSALQQIACFLDTEIAPHYTIKGFALESSDQQLLSELASLCAESFAIENIYNSETFLRERERLFAGVTHGLAMRFHGLVTMIGAGIVPLGLSYDPKVSALCLSAQLPCLELSNPACWDQLNAQTLQQLQDLDKTKLSNWRQEQAKKAQRALKSLSEHQ